MLNWLFPDPWKAFFRACDEIATPELEKLGFSSCGDRKENRFAARDYARGSLRYSIHVQNEYGSYTFLADVLLTDQNAPAGYLSGPFVSLTEVGAHFDIQLPHWLTLGTGKGFSKHGGSEQVKELVDQWVGLINRVGIPQVEEAVRQGPIGAEQTKFSHAKLKARPQD